MAWTDGKGQKQVQGQEQRDNKGGTVTEQEQGDGNR